MGHQFALDDDTYALVTELAVRRGSTPEAEVARLLQITAGEELRQQREFERLNLETRAFRALFGNDPPTSDHDWLYDEDGLPN